MNIEIKNFTDVSFTSDDLTKLKNPLFCFVVEFEKKFNDIKSLVNYNNGSPYSSPVIKDQYNHLHYIMLSSYFGKNVMIIYNGENTSYYLCNASDSDKIFEELIYDHKSLEYERLLKSCILKNITNKINFNKIIEIDW